MKYGELVSNSTDTETQLIIIDKHHFFIRYNINMENSTRNMEN
jgi:hypothetical protein